VSILELEGDLIHKFTPLLKLTSFLVLKMRTFNRNSLLLVDFSQEDAAEGTFSNGGVVVVCYFVQLLLCEYGNASCFLKYFTPIFVKAGPLHSPLSIHVNEPE